MKKRLLACLLTAAMLVSLFPLPALAAEVEPYTGGLCPHHTEHSYEVCGYVEAVEGQPCGHVHDGDCGFVEAVPEVPCDMDCAETDGDGQIVHNQGCAYTPAVEGAPYQHKHDGECGYVEAIEGQPCGYICPTCSMQAMNDLPTPLADETGDFTVTGGILDTEYTYNADTKTLTISTSGTYTITGTGVATTDKIVIADGVTADVTLQNVSIDVSGTRYACAFEVAGNAACNLTLQGINTLKSGEFRAGLKVQSGATVTINGPGSITANGSGMGAGIGGGYLGAGGIITINGGTVNATGSDAAAGIGGGGHGSGGTVTINGGTVTATGGGYAADIGGGRTGNGGNVTINDGTITAKIIGYGSDDTAANMGSGGTLTISGGTLKNAASRGDSFTMTGGTLVGCTIVNSSVSVDNATIQNSTVRNLSSWTDANNTVTGSTLNFSSEVTLTKGGTGNTYNGTVTIADSAEFIGDTTFNSAVTISGDNTSFSGNTTFGSTVDVAANKNVSLAGSTTLAGNMTLGADSSLTNSGTLDVPMDCTIINRGTITNQAEAVIDLSGTINDEDTPKGAVINDGTIFLIGNGQIIDYDNVTGNPPVPSGTTPIPAGEIVIDMSEVRNTVTIGPESYTIDGTSHTYDPAQNNIVLTGTYNNANISGTGSNRAAAVTVLENTTASIVLRDVYIGWEYDKDKNYCSSIWVKDYCTVTVFLEGTNTLKPRYISNGITTEEHSSLTVEGSGTLILDMSSTKYGGDAGIGNPNRNFGSITLNGGNIVTRTKSNYRLIGIGGKQGTVTINGGTLNGPYLFGDSSGGDITNEYQLIINGGIINSETKWNLNYGSLTINGGQMTISTVYCYGSSGGKIAVNGGQLTLTSTSTSEYMYGNITINGGTVTGGVNPTLYGGTKINGGTAKLTNNSDSLPVVSIKTTDDKTAYRTELTGQTDVADLLVDGKSQNISYNHPSDTSLYLYLVHDDGDNTTDSHTVVVMYQDESRKEYTATWDSTDNKFTFDTGSTSTPADKSSINLDLSGTTTGADGTPEKTYGDAAPVVVTVNLTTQTTNALPPANGPMLAAENSLPYAFKTVILLCNGKEIQRKDVPENQTSVVFYVQTQAWTPGEYSFTATYGGDANTGSSITTQAETLNIVGQTLDEAALNWNNVAVSGTYGQKVSDLTASGTVTQDDGTEIPGTWTVSDSNTDAVLDVGTMQTVTVTFTPTNTRYAPLRKTVTPTIAPKELTATISGTATKTYDGNTTATGLNIDLTGKVSGDDVSATAQTITYDNANVGTGKAITASGIALTGAKAGNYTLTNTTATTTGDITQATINGTLNITGTAVYGQTLTASYAPSNGETVSYQWNRGGAAISGATGSTYTLTADDIGQTITVTATPTDTTNYTGSVTSSATAAVAKATPTVKVEVALSGSTGAREAVLTVTVTGVTGGAAPTGTVTLTGDNGLNQTLNLTNGTASYTWSGLAEGDYTVTAAYRSDGNYNTASANKTFNTNKQEQDTLAIVSVGNKTYGDSAFILSTTGGSGNGAVTFTSSDPSVIRISGTTATATIHKAGGPVTITATKAENEHYNAATATLTVYVAKKAVVFKANDKTVQQGGTMPTFDYAPVTLAQGDSITTEPTAACTATDTNTTGTFPITLSGAVLSNGDSYDISYQPGTLTVTAKPSTGGGGGGGWYNPPTTYSVTIPTTAHGKVTVSPTSASRGATVTITAVPEDGYRLDTLNVTSGGKDITLTEKGSGKYTFTMPAGTVKVTATFVPAETPETPWNNPFADVSEGDWYYEAVRFVQERGLMNGYSDGRFGPNDTLSRAQLAQILFNKEGRPGVNYLLTFSDVAGEAWYTEAIRWATSQGIVSGYGNGTFGPNDPITREQLAVMLWRYVGSPAATNKELHFNDTDEISPFALEALRWAVENGILNGYGDGRLGPQGQATRAQVAQMLKNFIENQEENT